MEESYNLKKIMPGIIKFTITITILFAGMSELVDYKKAPVMEFCKNISPTASQAEVISIARKSGLPVINALEKRNMIMVLNHESPYFRFSCNVKFSHTPQLNKYVSVAD